MPEAVDNTEPYVYYVFPIYTYIFVIKLNVQIRHNKKWITNKQTQVTTVYYSKNNVNVAFPSKSPPSSCDDVGWQNAHVVRPSEVSDAGMVT